MLDFFMPPGMFITFEGLDGSGKSTQLKLLADFLKAEGKEVVTTREPGGNAVSDRIRTLLLDSRTSGLSPHAEMALMFASRAQNIQQVVLPALKDGKVVLCDRFTDSSEAYQGAGRGIGSTAVLAMHRLLCQGVNPELTFLLISDRNASLARARRRNADSPSPVDEDRFEQEDGGFYQRVAEAFLRIAEREPHRMAKIDATGSVEDTHRQIVAAYQERMASLARGMVPRIASGESADPSQPIKPEPAR